MRLLVRCALLLTLVLFAALLLAGRAHRWVAPHPPHALPGPINDCGGAFCWLGVTSGITPHADAPDRIRQYVDVPLSVRTSIGLESRDGYTVNFYPSADRVSAGGGQAHFFPVPQTVLPAGWLTVWLGEPCAVSYRSNIGYNPPVPEVMLLYPFLQAAIYGDAAQTFSPLSPVEQLTWFDPHFEQTPDVCAEAFIPGSTHHDWQGFNVRFYR